MSRFEYFVNIKHSALMLVYIYQGQMIIREDSINSYSDSLNGVILKVSEETKYLGTK